MACATTPRWSGRLGFARSRAWLQAWRPAAAVNVGLPLFWGWWLGGGVGGGRVVGGLVALGLVMQGAIVLFNDVADREADAGHAQPTVFSGGSRVLQAGALSEQALRRVGWTCVVAVLGLAFVLGGWVGAALAAVGLLLVQAYSFGPLRLNYRCGGELLQAIGVAGVMPTLGWVVAGGGFDAVPRALWFGHGLVQLGAALAVTLPDREADRGGGKRTLAVHAGVVPVAVFACLLAGAGWWLGQMFWPGLVFAGCGLVLATCCERRRLLLLLFVLSQLLGAVGFMGVSALAR